MTELSHFYADFGFIQKWRIICFNILSFFYFIKFLGQALIQNTGTNILSFIVGSDKLGFNEFAVT